MSILTDWRPLSTEELMGSIPGLIERVESSLEDFPAEHQEKNLTAIEALKKGAPTSAEIEDPSKNGNLVTLAFAVEQLARILAKSATPEQSLALFRSAHEIFRATISSTGPNKQMRQVLPAALRTLIMTEIERVRTGETDAGLVHENLNNIVSSAWGTIPPQLALMINEILLSELERVRSTIEKDKALHERFITDNIESVLSLEVPQRLAEVQDRWEEIGAHVAPTATRTAGRVLHRPQDLSELLLPESWKKIKAAVEEGNVEILRSSLAEVEDVLVKNLRLRLDAKADFREPISQLGTRHNPDRYFVEAHDLLLRDGTAALRKFSDIHFRRNNNTTAKEWYAYALARFGEKTDTHDVIELLEDVIQSEYYRQESNWTANWNLACALRRLPTRADESLDLLVPILKNQYHPSEVFELSLLWSLDQDREEILPELLGRSYYFEAQLLAALYAAELLQGDDELSGDHFRRVGRILRDPDHEFPDPKERLSFGELDQLTREFMENSMVPAGIEWFHQRLSDQQGRFYSKNWDCAAKLHEEADNKEAAWQCHRRVWDCLVRDRKTDLDRKIGKLKFILNWSQRNGFEKDALSMIKSSWQRIGMSESDLRIWEQRLTKTSLYPQPPARTDAVPTSTVPTKPFTSDSIETGLIREDGVNLPTATLIEADKVIQEIAGTFSGVSAVETLSGGAGNAERLLSAVQMKRPDVSSVLFSSIREVIRLAKEFSNGVDGTQAQDLVQRMKLQLGALRNNRESLPYEIRGLGQACERVIQNTCVRTGATTEITITPPDALKFVFEAGAPDKTRYASRMFARLCNPGLEEMRNINSVFSSPSSGIRFSGEGMPILRLNPGEKQIVECAFDVIGDLENEVSVRVHVTYSAGGVQLTNHVNCRIPVGTIRKPVPVTVRYVTGAPVGADRVDLFHGRHDELLDLQEAFAGDFLRKLYFVNGIRRVGKSSLIEHLGKHCGREVLTLSLKHRNCFEQAKDERHRICGPAHS
ncbi:MAG: hypothetical protein H7Z16_08540 [Pyrinomonadaceae bacterium]|nr:hypothetical protein [Pyrinomonadaceae bacterium]